jgi:hypothetical protein
MSPIAEFPQVKLPQLKTMIAVRSSMLAMQIRPRRPLRHGPSLP